MEGARIGVGAGAELGTSADRRGPVHVRTGRQAPGRRVFLHAAPKFAVLSVPQAEWAWAQRFPQGAGTPVPDSESGFDHGRGRTTTAR